MIFLIYNLHYSNFNLTIHYQVIKLEQIFELKLLKNL